MPLTPNLGLTTINRAQEAGTKLVTEWIDDISGSESSNMTIIDEAVGDLREEKLDKTSIADNLTTDSATQAASARQAMILDETKLNKAGGTISGNMTPDTANTRDLGSPALSFRGVYSKSFSSPITNDFYIGKTPPFTNGIANEKVDVVLGKISISGTFSVKLVGGWINQNAVGLLEKTYTLSLGLNGTKPYYNDRYTFVSETRAIAAISEVKWSDEKGWYITIVKRIAATDLNSLSVYISQIGLTLMNTNLISFSSIYTTDTTILPIPNITLYESPALGSNDLQPATTKFFQRELGAISKNIVPNTDNTLIIGAADKRWKDFYLASGTISTSDEREKKDINDISEAYKNFFYNLRPVRFEFNEGIRTHLGLISQEVEAAMYESGLNSLDFAGFINSPITAEIESDELEEQDVEEESVEEQEFEEEVIEEVEVEEEEVYIDENGEEQVHTYTVVKNVPVMKTVKRLVPMIKTVKKLVPKMKTVITGERYGLRYEEFIPLLIKMTQLQQEEIDKLTKRIEALEPMTMPDGYEEEEPQETLQ